jgi:predicted nucleic acid-binding Zn ribbon protein
MAKGESRSERVATVLHDVLTRIDPDKRLRAFEVWNFWDEVVGQALARRAQPSGYRNGVLFVTVGAHAWMQELQFMKQQLRERLNARLGSELIRDIDLACGAIEPPSPAPEVAPQASAAPRPSVPLPAIDNPELAAVFQRIVRAHTRQTGGASSRSKRRS